jgi:hypothetical protein
MAQSSVVSLGDTEVDTVASGHKPPSTSEQTDAVLRDPNHPAVRKLSANIAHPSLKTAGPGVPIPLPPPVGPVAGRI